MTQYLPDSFGGYLFIGAFNAIPAGPLILAWWLRGKLPVTWILSLLTATALLCWIHHDYDLSEDAQSAIGLVIFPFLVAVPTALVAVISGIVEALVRKGNAAAAAKGVAST
jgi:hypothetical protein